MKTPTNEQIIQLAITYREAMLTELKGRASLKDLEAAVDNFQRKTAQARQALHALLIQDIVKP